MFVDYVIFRNYHAVSSKSLVVTKNSGNNFCSQYSFQRTAFSGNHLIYNAHEPKEHGVISFCAQNDITPCLF